MKKLLMIMALVLCTGGIVHAQGLSVNAETSVGASLKSASTTVQINANSNANLGSSSASGNSSSTTTAAMNDENGNDGNNAGVGVVGLGHLKLNAHDFDNMSEDDKADFFLTVKDHAELRSDQDLENFAKGILVDNDNVEEVEIDDNDVMIKYDMPARFLGIFQTSLDAEVEVTFAADGSKVETIDAHFPWYRFLFSLKDEVKSETLEGKLSKRLDNRDIIVSATSTAGLAVRNGRAVQVITSLLDDIRASVEASADAQADVETDSADEN